MNKPSHKTKQGGSKGGTSICGAMKGNSGTSKGCCMVASKGTKKVTTIK